ncbi:ABC-2 type transport system ATP-binding protein [Larkinella arboricola]|uniref:ABC-2 type transport system ATP-binding protein n=1 Tax=Larkinella arboricola TaxID=643671 RepID=A0A327X6A3_LARAB|nr:ABC transporter ATP-binding protein [Larkinella arboricola]RAK02199.1 ABC-2 type transport system ATP-binding protein [Larkinella arboricola]
MLTVRNFRKAYQDRLVLDISRADFPAGVHWIKGRNGSGKTTFFRSVAGLLPFGGNLILENRYDLRKHPVEYRLRVNYGEAEPIYPAFLTAWELIRWVGATKQAPLGQADELIDRFGIRDFMKAPLGTYSSGMLKKTSLVLAFLGNPTLILLDEPLITLDQATTRTVLDSIRQSRQQGISFLLSTHQDVDPVDLPIDFTWMVGQQTLAPFPQPADQ